MIKGVYGYLCRNLRKMLPHFWESSCHCLGLGNGGGECWRRGCRNRRMRRVTPFHNEKLYRPCISQPGEHLEGTDCWSVPAVNYLPSTARHWKFMLWIWRVIQFQIHLIVSVPTPDFSFLFTTTCDHERPSQVYLPDRFPGAFINNPVQVFSKPL